LVACHASVLTLLAARHTLGDRDVLHDAFVQALLELCASPGRVDPARGAWRPLLFGAARRAPRPLVRSGRRRRLGEEKRARGVAGPLPAARSLLDERADRELAEAALGVARPRLARAVQKAVTPRGVAHSRPSGAAGVTRPHCSQDLYLGPRLAAKSPHDWWHIL
jgi:hypothetical protein